jgi:hypothetical protein
MAEWLALWGFPRNCVTYMWVSRAETLNMASVRQMESTDIRTANSVPYMDKDDLPNQSRIAFLATTMWGHTGQTITEERKGSAPLMPKFTLGHDLNSRSWTSDIRILFRQDVVY